jgi:hypothetical protein
VTCKSSPASKDLIGTQTTSSPPAWPLAPDLTASHHDSFVIRLVLEAVVPLLDDGTELSSTR